MVSFVWRVSIAVGCVLVAGCSVFGQRANVSKVGESSSGANAAADLLKRSMDRYAALPAFSATVTYSMDAGHGRAPATDSTRTMEIEKPNLFHVISKSATGFTQTCVSDGKNEIEYSEPSLVGAMTYSSPAQLCEVRSMQMRHPMFCGTLLYQFFGGSTNYSNLVDESKGPVTYGDLETVAGGETARVVKFYATQTYGHTEVMIGERSLLVYRIRYDNEPLMTMVKGMLDSSKQPNLGNAGSSLASEEDYNQIKTPKTIPASEFKAIVPKGLKTMDLSKMLSNTGSEPGVPLGLEAPDFTVTKLDGSSVRLSSLRGHPVMLDFWATWCGPCRQSLPTTAAIAKKGAAQGLEVLAISDEDTNTVTSFMQQNHYMFSACLDSSDKAEQAYRVKAIPTTVILDASGKVRAYIVGGGQDDRIYAGLAKVGVTLGSD